MLFYFHRKKKLNPLEFVTKVPCFIKWLYLFLLQSVFSHPHFPQELRLTAWNSLRSGLHLRRWFLCTKLIVKSLGIFSGWWIGWWVFWNVPTDFFCSSLLLCVFFFYVCLNWTIFTICCFRLSNDLKPLNFVKSFLIIALLVVSIKSISLFTISLVHTCHGDTKTPTSCKCKFPSQTTAESLSWIILSSSLCLYSKLFIWFIHSMWKRKPFNDILIVLVYYLNLF